MSVRKFKIKIDGKIFEAEVEEQTEGAPAAVENRREKQRQQRQAQLRASPLSAAGKISNIPDAG